MTRTCMSCPNELGPRNQTGRCKSCATRKNNVDPVLAAKRHAGIRRRFEDPAYREQHAARCRVRNRNMSDETREQRRKHGLTLVGTLAKASQQITKEQRVAAGIKRSATMLAWCPVEWRDKYRDLCKRGRRAAEAKQIVLDLIAGRSVAAPYANQRKILAWCPESRRAEYTKLQKALGAAEARRILEADLSPFERQMARINAGAQVVAVPDTRTGGPAYTLGGIASGML